MKLSIVIPAFNEEKRLPACLASVEHALNEVAVPRGLPREDVEVIVTDNNSTDRTTEVARQAGARVVFEPVNQISRARNAGASVASGEWLLFIDADSVLSPVTLAELLAVIDSGRYAGGGCVVGLDRVPAWGKLGVATWNCTSRLLHWAAGSFFFCRTDAFRALGGFSLELYAAEEISLSLRLNRWAREHGLRTKILTATPHISSGRKFELYRWHEVAWLIVRSLFRTRKTLTRRGALDFFYDGRR